MTMLTIFGFDACPYCKMAKKMCYEAGVKCTMVDVTAPQNRKYLQQLLENGFPGVPVIFDGQSVIGGLPDLDLYLKTGNKQTPKPHKQMYCSRQKCSLPSEFDSQF
jgi:glutaredoxin